MAGKNTSAYGIYPTQADLERGVDALKAADFRNADISVLFPDNEGSKEFAHEKNTKAPEGATTGATTGALLGGGLGWLIGIGALAIPWSRALHCGWSHRGCISRRGRWRRCGRFDGSPRRSWHSGV